MAEEDVSNSTSKMETGDEDSSDQKREKLVLKVLREKLAQIQAEVEGRRLESLFCPLRNPGVGIQECTYPLDKTEQTIKDILEEILVEYEDELESPSGNEAWKTLEKRAETEFDLKIANTKLRIDRLRKKMTSLNQELEELSIPNQENTKS